MVNPYVDQNTSNQTWQRIFSASVPDSQLVWHRDHKSRLVTVKSGQGWQIQMDNQLPVPLQVGSTHEIPAQVYHRIIRGVDDLIIEIREQP